VLREREREREREWGGMCRMNNIYEACGCFTACVLTRTKLGKLATSAHIALTDCFTMIDWRLA
jgi:hypothetical protein